MVGIIIITTVMIVKMAMKIGMIVNEKERKISL